MLESFGPGEGSNELFAHLIPVRYLFHRRSHRRHIVEHIDEQEEYTEDTHKTEHLLDACKQRCLRAKGKCPRHVVSHVIAYAVREQSRGDCFHHAIARESGNSQSHEEMLKGHELLKIDGQCGEVNGVAERAAVWGGRDARAAGSG